MNGAGGYDNRGDITTLLLLQLQQQICIRCVAETCTCDDSIASFPQNANIPTHFTINLYHAGCLSICVLKISNTILYHYH